jgi:hypothetical protein
MLEARRCSGSWRGCGDREAGACAGTGPSTTTGARGASIGSSGRSSRSRAGGGTLPRVELERVE